MEFVEVFILQRHTNSSEYYVINDTLCLLSAVCEGGQREMLTAANLERARLSAELEDARRAAIVMEEKSEDTEKRLREDLQSSHKVSFERVHVCLDGV